MSFSSSQKDSSGTQTFAPDPTWLGTLYGNLNRAQGVANTPFQPYGGQMTAGFTPYQSQAQAGAAGIAAGQVGAAPVSAAVNTAQGVAGYTPQTIQAPMLSGMSLSPYLNPFQSSVIDATLGDLNRQRQIQSQADSAQATQAHAFGGSRSAVLQNLSDDSWQRNLGSTLAGLNQANFSQAQAAAQSDLSRQMAADQANQSAGLQGQGLRLNAASAMAGMGDHQLNQALQRNAALGAAGDAQQKNQQDRLNAAYQQWQLAQQYPIQMQQLLNQTVATLPSYGTTSTTGSESESGGGFNLASYLPFLPK